MVPNNGYVVESSRRHSDVRLCSRDSAEQAWLRALKLRLMVALSHSELLASSTWPALADRSAVDSMLHSSSAH